MFTPAGRRQLLCCSTVSAVVWLSPLTLAADEVRSDARQAIQSGLPRYDPAAYEKARAEKETRTAPRNAPAPIPENTPTAPVPAAATPAGDNILVLPKMTVRSNERPIKRLPRIDPPAPPLKDLPSEPFESATGRDARLVKNHLNKLQQILIPLFGGSVVGEAREAEARLQKAAQMNDLASSLELQEAAGRDPEEIKRLRAEYVKLYYSGPK